MKKEVKLLSIIDIFIEMNRNQEGSPEFPYNLKTLFR